MKWYVIRVATGKEKKILESIDKLLKKNNNENLISSILIPSEKKIQIRNSKKYNVEKLLYPGYIFIECESINDVESKFKYIDGVSSVLKKPLSDVEVERMLMKENRKEIDEKFIINQKVKIIDGPFNGFFGTIQNIDLNKQKVKISVNIFERENILELKFEQISHSED